MRLQEGSEVLKLIEVDSLIYINQSNHSRVSLLKGSRTDTWVKNLRYRCSDDDNFYSVDYDFSIQSYAFQPTLNGNYIKFVNEVDIPLQNSIEASSSRTSEAILNLFANKVTIWIYNNIGSPVKLSLFTTTHGETNLEEINQFNNANLTFHESIELGGKIFNNVYQNKRDELEGSEIFFSNEMGIIQFTDHENQVLTLDSIIYY